jgi:hypothetical protein
MATEPRQHPVLRVHRWGAVVLALILWAFGILGFLGHSGFFSTHGTHVAGMTSNGLLSTISLLVGAVLIGAAARGARAASTACVVIGGLFILSGLLNLIGLVHPNLNVLAFTMPNVIFSLVVGLALLSVGLYGRASSQLPADNPYRQSRGGDNPLSRVWQGEQLAQGPVQDVDAEERRLAETTQMAEAEHAFAEGTATQDQERAVLRDAHQRAAERREDAWHRTGGQDHDPRG